MAAGAGFYIYRKRSRPGNAVPAKKALHAEDLTTGVGGAGGADSGDASLDELAEQGTACRPTPRGSGAGRGGQPPGPNAGLDSFLTQPAVPSGSGDGIDTFMTVAVQTASQAPDGNAAPWTGALPAAVGPLQAGIKAAAEGGPSSAADAAAAATGATGALVAAQLPPGQVPCRLPAHLSFQFFSINRAHNICMQPGRNGTYGKLLPAGLDLHVVP